VIADQITLMSPPPVAPMFGPPASAPLVENPAPPVAHPPTREALASIPPNPNPPFPVKPAIPGPENPPSPWAKLAVVTTLILLITLAVILVVDKLRHPAQDPLVLHFEGIKRISRINLVRHTYMQVIPFTKDTEPKKGESRRLEFLLEAPAYVSGLIDLSKMEYERDGSDWVKVELPEPELSAVRFDLQQAREARFRGKSVFRLGEGGRPYEQAYAAISSTMALAKEDIRRNAIANGILEDTRRRARTFIQNQVRVLGVGVRFIGKKRPLFETPDADSTAADNNKKKSKKDPSDSNP
jgi:hypothetical protein